MAGSNSLYLEPIINGAVGDMGANISAMNTQLSETTRILMNILNNQGLEQHQTVYNGATLAALTLVGGTDVTYNVNVGTNTILSSNSIKAKAGNSFIFETTDTDLCNFTNITTVTINDTYNNCPFKYLDLIDDENNTTTITTVSGSHLGTATIPEENRKQYSKIIARGSGNFPTEITFSNITFNGSNFAIKEIAHLGFNSNNILKLVGTNELNLDILFTETKTGYLTLLDIQNVSNWVSCLLKGNLEGISVALVDNTSHEIIKILATSTADLSDISVFTNLALMVTFAAGGNGTNYLSGVTMRYY